MTPLQGLILAVVEGVTEYLPISSTGHMIVTSALMGINEEAFTKDFTVIVQFGAILAVLVLYWRRFVTSWRFYQKLALAFLPAALIGFAVKNKIDALLGDPMVVAISFIVGGIILLFVDRWFAAQEKRLSAQSAGHVAELTTRQSLLIGLSQCVAFIPGVSRSAASIVGALSVGLTRQAAAEFSFFLAVPTLTAATALKLLKMPPELFQRENIGLLLTGNLVAFVVALITIKTFIGYLTRRGFFWFGVYRILIGAAIMALMLSGISLKML